MAHKFTDGPWEVGELDRNDQRTVIGDGGALVAVCPHECLASNEPIMEANAVLIAAAPDLLEALKALHARSIQEIVDPQDVWEIAASAAAIAKAEAR